MNNQTKKIKFQIPHAYVIIFLLLIFVSLMTYVIPAGSYERYEDPATGTELVEPGTYQQTEASPVSPLEIPTMVVDSMTNNAELIFSIIIISGALEIILGTGMFHAFCNKLSKVCAGGKEKFFIPLIMLVFTILGLTQSTDKFIGFAPIGVMLALTLGYDAIVGIAMVLLGVGISFSAGPLHATTAVAQEIAGLPLYSGMGFRIVTTVILYIVTVFYTVRYAMRIKQDPTKSYLHGVTGILEFDPKDAEVSLCKRHYAILAIFIVGIAVLMYGCKTWNWGMAETSVLFIWLGIICGIVYGTGPSKICKLFIKGANASTGAALVVGLGAAVSLVLTSAGIIDTVVMNLSNLLNYMPLILKAPAMFLVNIVINFFIPSGNGQAAVVMPIMAPMSDVIGISRQNAVYCFKLGDGLCNYILPHASALMGFLGVTGVPYDKWMKFMWKLFCIWLAVGIVLSMIATVMNY